MAWALRLLAGHLAFTGHGNQQFLGIFRGIFEAHAAPDDYVGRKARSAKAETPNAPATTRVPARRASPIAGANTFGAPTDTTAARSTGRMASTMARQSGQTRMLSIGPARPRGPSFA